MGPEYWKPDKTTHLKRCSERTSNDCNPDETDTCCAVIPCSYCLSWVPYTGGEQTGTALWSGTAWTGTVAFGAFIAYWERNESGVCEFIVTLDGVEVYRQNCYGGQSCRDSSDSVSATLDTVDGTLTWTRIEHRQLEYINGSDGCKTWFCNDCECSCKTLCATLITASPGCCSVKFQMTDDTYPVYPCEPPTWSADTECDGTPYSVTLTLSRREYDGQCMLGGSVNGSAFTEVEVGGCIGWTSTLTAADGTVLSVECDACDCSPDDTCTTGCCWPLVFNDQYPCGYRTPVPFEISAPGCDMDGITGEFTPALTTSRGTCGECSMAPPVFIKTTLGVKKVPVPGFGYCNDTPCGVSVAIMLVCDDSETQPYGTDECCGKMRLWVSTSERMVGYDGTAPPGGDPTRYWIKITPSSCTCLPDSGGLSAIFEVTLILDCAEVYDDGACIGLPKNCCNPICTAFTVVI